MSLEMKSNCERCGKPLPLDSDEANICSYECTFCNDCANTLDFICPNYKGELIERPRRDMKNKSGYISKPNK